MLLSAVTEYGARLAADDAAAPGAVRQGALDEAELARLVGDAVAVVDATHPFAAEISRGGRGGVRARRQAVPAGTSGRRPSCPARRSWRATRTAPRDGRARLRPVEQRTAAGGDPAHRRQQDRRHVRPGGARGRACAWSRACCPTAESLAACAAAGLEPRDVVAMQGPTSAELDAALLRHLGAAVLVTKDSGAAGGLGEKLRAAELAGATAVVVRRPQDAGAPSRGAPRAGARPRCSPGSRAASAAPRIASVARGGRPAVPARPRSRPSALARPAAGLHRRRQGQDDGRCRAGSARPRRRPRRRPSCSSSRAAGRAPS